MGFLSGLSDFAGNLTGGLIGSSDAEDAARDAKKLSREITQLNIDDFLKYFGETEESFGPYLHSGSQAIVDIMDSRFGDPEVPELAAFAYPDIENPQLDPFRYATPETPELQQFVFDATQLGGTDAYQWRYGEGLRATERSLAANRNLGSGNRLTALQEYGQGMASQEYENEWQRQLATNLNENQRRIQGYEMDVNRFNQERDRWADENARRLAGHELDVDRFYSRPLQAYQTNRDTSRTQYAMDQDQYRAVMDRLFRLAGSGQTAVTNLAGQRAYTTGGITGARGQNAANQFSASLIPVQETQNFTSGLFNLGGTIAGKVL